MLNMERSRLIGWLTCHDVVSVLFPVGLNVTEMFRGSVYGLPGVEQKRKAAANRSEPTIETETYQRIPGLPERIMWIFRVFTYPKIH